MNEGLPPLEQLASDLRYVSRLQVAISLAMPPCLVVAYTFVAALGWWPAAFVCIGAFTFCSYTSISHDLVHRTLGLSSSKNAMLLSLVEGLGLRSGTAYRLAHLQHHRVFPSPEDVEAHAAASSIPAALAAGIVGPIRCWRWAYERYPRDRLHLRREAIAIVVVIMGSLAMLPWTPIPAVYVGASLAAGVVLPVATVYLPHRKEGANPLERTRLFRGRLWTLLFANHLFHLEHHLYPSIPHHHWPELARRLDPHFARLGIEPVKSW